MIIIISFKLTKTLISKLSFNLIKSIKVYFIKYLEKRNILNQFKILIVDDYSANFNII